MSPGRIGFSIFCILGIVAIFAAAILEIVRYRRGGGLIGFRQFRLRMISSVVWSLVLLVNLYAVTSLWPAGGNSPAARAEAKQFLTVIGGGFSLLIVALILLMIDLWQTARERQLHEARFKTDLIGKAREDALRLKHPDRS